MILTKSLTKVYKSGSQEVVGLSELDLDIKSGEIVGLLGPNGAGKTTTINLLTTILSPTKGGALVNGYDILQEPLEVRASIGLAGDTPGFYNRLTAYDNLWFFGNLYDTEDLRSRIRELSILFNLDDVLDRKVGVFSKGMMQKLLLMKAMLHDPPLLFLDEPWSGLSPLAQKELRELLEQITTKEKRTVVISTHNLAQAERLVDRLVILNKGKKIEDSTPDQLREKFLVHSKLSLEIEEAGQDIDKHLFDSEYVVEISEKIPKQNGRVELKLSTKGFEHTPEIIKHVVHQGFKVHQVREVVPSLEEIYLGLVGDERG